MNVIQRYKNTSEAEHVEILYVRLYSGFMHVLRSNVGLYFCKTSQFHFTVTFSAGHISLT